MARRLLGSALALALVAAACSGEATSTTTTTLPATTTTPSTQPTTTTADPVATGPTSTIPYAALDVVVPDRPEVTAEVNAFYAWFGDRTLPTPNIPEGLVDFLSDQYPTTGSASYTGEFFGATIEEMGTVGVVVVNDDDVILVVDELEEEGEADTGWRVVGAWMPQYGIDAWFGNPVRYVFLIGTDARPGQDQQHFRADSLHILSSNVAERSGGILGFPRDTLVEASYGFDKFANVNAFAWTISDNTVPAQPQMVELASELSGLPIEGWIVTGFLNFTRLVDAFGGVQVDVPFAMAEPKSEAYLSAGLQTLFGSDALAFSRNRTLAGGDFTRSFHHGLVILGALGGVLERDITMLPELLTILMEYTWTGLSLEDLFTVAAGAFLLEPDRVGNDVLPGEVGTFNGFSIVNLSPGAEDMFRDMDDGILNPREEEDE